MAAFFVCAIGKEMSIRFEIICCWLLLWLSFWFVNFLGAYTVSYGNDFRACVNYVQHENSLMTNLKIHDSRAGLLLNGHHSRSYSMISMQIVALSMKYLISLQIL